MRRIYYACLALLLSLLLASCQSGSVYDLPLPGGADLGDAPYELTVQFDDVVQLVPQAMVKVDGVQVGRVQRIQLADDGWTPEVTVLLPRSVRISPDAQVELKQTSLLGEKYVSFRNPPGGAQGQVRPGTVIPVSRTDRGVEIEQVLGALSMVLNGGSLEQVRTITREINAALSGNEAEIKSLLSDLDTFVGALDEHRDEITRAIDSLDGFARQLRARTDQIAAILDGIGPGLAVLEAQRSKLVAMLGALDRLSTQGVDVINKSQAAFVDDLRQLTPLLRQLVKSAEDIATSLSVVPTYPFHDNTIHAIKGTYMQGHLRATLDLTDILGNLGRTQQPIFDTGIVGGPQTKHLSEDDPQRSPGRVPLLPVPVLPGGPSAGNGSVSEGGLQPLLDSLLGGR